MGIFIWKKMGSHGILTDEELAFMEAYNKKHAAASKSTKKRLKKKKIKPEKQDAPARTVYAVRHTKYQLYELRGEDADKFEHLTSVQDAQDAVKRAAMRVAQWSTQRRGETREILTEVKGVENATVDVSLSPSKFQPITREILSNPTKAVKKPGSTKRPGTALSCRRPRTQGGTKRRTMPRRASVSKAEPEPTLENATVIEARPRPKRSEADSEEEHQQAAERGVGSSTGKCRPQTAPPSRGSAWFSKSKHQRAEEEKLEASVLEEAKLQQRLAKDAALGLRRARETQARVTQKVRAKEEKMLRDSDDVLNTYKRSKMPQEVKRVEKVIEMMKNTQGIRQPRLKQLKKADEVRLLSLLK